MADHNIVLFPFMAQGHLIPFLALADLIQQRNPTLTITLVNTPRNVENLRSILPPGSAVRLHALPFSPSDHGLPSENTDSLSIPQIIRLFHASRSLRPDFHQFIATLTEQHGRPPLCIVADVFLGWTVEVAKSLGIFHACFTTSGAYGTVSFMSLWLHLPHAKTDSPEFHLPGFPEDFRLHRSQMSTYMRAADGTDPYSTFFGKEIELSLGSDTMLCNTVEEVEVFGLELLRKYTGLRVWPTGPLLPLQSNTSRYRVGKKPGIEIEYCMKWLDSHAPSSVIYVSFGSQNTIAASQMMALASGLEASGVPFVWVIRPPSGFHLNGEFKDEWLPQGFEVRTRERMQGLLVRGWAPQLEILSHKSVGAFLSHCGWNSVLESLSRGVPIIGWPLASEQFYNSKMLEDDLGAGVEVARGVVDEVHSNKVGSVIKMVMAGVKGKEMKEKAMAFSEKIKAAMREDAMEKGSSLQAIDELVKTLVETKGSPL